MILEVFYDANCPFCVRRAEWIRKNDTEKHIMLSDLNKNLLILDLFGISSEDAYEDIHAVYRNGEVIKGVEVVRAVLDILGYRKLLRLINSLGIWWIFNKIYSVIKRNKQYIGW